MELCTGVLSEDPLFVALNSYTTGLSPSVMAYLLGTTVGKRFAGKVTADEIGLRGNGIRLGAAFAAPPLSGPGKACFDQIPRMEGIAMENIITTEDLYFEYRNEEDSSIFPVLKGIDLEIPQGQFVAVLGHNGSGKSTLAKHFNAILLPTSGRVLVAGIDTADESRLFDIRAECRDGLPESG